MKPIPYGKQNITEEDIKVVTAVLTSDFLTQGPKVTEFEEAFAQYIGCKYAVAVANGTAALHLSVMALRNEVKLNVITTPITFAASANSIRYCDGNVFFADIDPVTCTLDIEAVKKLISSKPKGFFSGIIPVDFGGYAVDLEAFHELAREHNLWIIEDACHAPGGYFIDSTGNKQKCGNGVYADLAVFSFHPVKHITSGEGGMITTNDQELYKKLLLLRTHGITKANDEFQNDISIAAGGEPTETYPSWYMEMQELGYNYRLTDFQAVLGTSQLSRADEGIKRRVEIAEKYNASFANTPGIIAQAGVCTGHAYHLYVIQVENRLALFRHLKQQQIHPQIHYIPTHLMPYYQSLGWKQGDMPMAENYYKHCLSLPMYPTLTEEEQQFVINTILGFNAATRS
jgi:UDP-4-amino-4,6-dideoxy-N-acetyl-beta-L-altrosamine transaminase